MSAPACGRYCWVQSVIILLGLGFLAFWALREPLIPTEDDCLIQGRPSDCWRDTGKEAYDLEERPRR